LLLLTASSNAEGAYREKDVHRFRSSSHSSQREFSADANTPKFAVNALCDSCQQLMVLQQDGIMQHILIKTKQTRSHRFTQLSGFDADISSLLQVIQEPYAFSRMS
jgi:hypothetical protein